MLTEEQIISGLLGNKQIDWDCTITKREGHCTRCGCTLLKLEKRARVFTVDERGKFNNNRDLRVLFCKECFLWFIWIYLNDKRKLQMRDRI